MTTQQLTIDAIGRPITQGSKTRTRWGMRDDNADRLKPWRDTLTTAAIDALADAPPIEGPVVVEVEFRFARPAGHYGTGRNADQVRASAPVSPVGRNIGDVDKLSRAVLDAMTTARVWVDDSQVVSLFASKVWVGRGEREGATVVVNVDVRSAAGAQGVA